MLEDGTSDAFVEVDAATNSGKDDVKRITEEIQYSTFSGRHRIYLFDEAHQLSPGALDALLKPMEENIHGSDDKSLVCIFCTTEPERMRATVLSRCAPAFRIQTMSPEAIAERLQFVCEQEGLTFEADVLPLIAEITECHVRDALKAIEGVSMLGALNRENVSAYLHLDLNALYIDLLQAIGSDGKAVIDLANQLLKKVSPLTCYGRLAELAMVGYQMHLGVTRVESFLNKERMAHLATKGETLLGYVSRFASRPGRPTSSMLLCDISYLHRFGGAVGELSDKVVVQVNASSTVALRSSEVPASVGSPVAVMGKVELQVVEEPYRISERAVFNPSLSPKAKEGRNTLDSPMFCFLLGTRLRELGGADRGQARHSGVGSP